MLDGVVLAEDRGEAHDDTGQGRLDVLVAVSDELLEEVVIANCAEKSKLTAIELFQLHLRNGHCGADRLNKISGEPLDFCSRVIAQCVDCVEYGVVRTQKQILGTIEDPKPL